MRIAAFQPTRFAIAAVAFAIAVPWAHAQDFGTLDSWRGACAQSGGNAPGCNSPADDAEDRREERRREAARRHNQANALNAQGIAASRAGDVEAAQRFYEEASRLWPEEPHIARNLRRNQERLGAYRESASTRQAATNAAATVQNQQVGSVVSGLSLLTDAGASDASALNQNPMAVDTRGAQQPPPPFPAHAADIVNSPGYDAMRRGLQATARADWQLALAWYQTALQRDPNNRILRQAVETAHWAYDTHRNPRPSPADLPLADPRADVMQRTDAMLPPPITPRALTEQEDMDLLIEITRDARAESYGLQAMTYVHDGDYAAGIAWMEAAEREAPSVSQYRAAREYLQSRLAAGQPTLSEATRD